MVVIILAVAPDAEPVIFSPLVNVPVIEQVSVGAEASALVSSESNTPTNLNTSALPKDIALSVGLVPNASVAPVATFNCLQSCVVLAFDATLVLKIVATNFTLAPFARFELSVIVRVAVPAPAIVDDILKISPCEDAPPEPAVRTDIV